MTNEAELRRLVYGLDNPLGDLRSGIKALWKLSEAFPDGEDQMAVAFIAKHLDMTLDEVDKLHSGLYRALSSNGESIEPTPLHSA